MLIVEDREPWRSALREFLQSSYPAAIILEAVDGVRALEPSGGHGPRLMSMDGVSPALTASSSLPK
jgi:DNA-binding NarL/FixJ family response regulator